MKAHHVVAIHDHENIFDRNIRRFSGARVNFVHENVVQVCALAIELPWLLDAISYVKYVTMTCKITQYYVNGENSVFCAQTTVREKTS